MSQSRRYSASDFKFPSLEGMLRFLPKTMDNGDRHIALIGTVPPRQCGIATFTADVQRSLALMEGWTCDIVPIVEDSATLDPSIGSMCIRQFERGDYQRAADRLNHLGVDVVSIQHEFGIFGGHDGSYILDLMDRLTCQVVVTMHTVIETPTRGQRLVISAILRRADHIIVMAQKGASILEEVYGAQLSKVTVCPHGTPDRPFCATDGFKGELDLEGHQVLLTFGLLSPGKGLETMIGAMPAIVKANPQAVYVILGATHPNLKKIAGEAYRQSLMDLAKGLGVEGHIRFVDAFVDEDLLLTYLGAADIYVTPYLNEAQVTSGTLAYAIALGKPVVSTPFWHALEWVDETTGALVAFGDMAGFSSIINALLSDPDRLLAASKAAYEKGRQTIWARSAETYLDAFRAAIELRGEAPIAFGTKLNQESPSLFAVQRATDSCGIIQHSTYGIDHRSHGYCIDDNVRALILIQRFRQLGHKNHMLDELERLYGAFVQHAWNPNTQRFRNFMGYDRSWCEDIGSEDSNGRAFWALGTTARCAADPQIRLWAAELAKQVYPAMLHLGSLRAQCFVILGAVAFLQRDPDDYSAQAVLIDFADNLMARFKAEAAPNWVWLEPMLSYDNARLPQALIEAGVSLARPDILEAGLASLNWLATIQRTSSGLFRAVGSSTPSLYYAPPTVYDQQPIEACATIDAALSAFVATKQAKFLTMAQTAYGWFFGENENGLPLTDYQGGCFDGLTPLGVNRNQGAESILALQMSNAAMAFVSTLGTSAPKQRLGLHM